METTTLLPDPQRFHLECVTSSAAMLTICVSSVQARVGCPVCGQPTERIHSRYERTLADLPWNRLAVSVHLRVRKFFCDNPACERVVFTEPLPDFAARYARKTCRLQAALSLIGYALGGEVGARVAVGLGLQTSPDTLVRQLRQHVPPPPDTSVRVLGVDDFAFRKGQRYGTILVDLERRRVLDLLPDRAADSLAAWLQSHPGVEIISRDRASAYADAARQAAPQARQIADRFHLLQNLVEAVQRLLLRCQRPLSEALQQAAASLAPPLAPEANPPLEQTETSPVPTQAEQERQARRERRLSRYEQVWEWHRQGAPIHQIARNLKMHRRTVRQFLRTTAFPERASPARRSNQHTPFHDYLHQRWEQGCHNAAQLYRELQERGFTGSASALRQYLRSWRTTLPETLQDRRGRKRGTAPPVVTFSPRTTAWLLVGYAKSKESRQQTVNAAFLNKLTSLCPDIAQAQALAQQFFAMVRQRQGGDLKAWMEKAAGSNLPELMSFARGLNADYEAVLAGLSDEWSNAQVEGQVNRLKLVKRSMYGRAKFDLLKARVLPNAQAV